MIALDYSIRFEESLTLSFGYLGAAIIAVRSASGKSICRPSWGSAAENNTTGAKRVRSLMNPAARLAIDAISETNVTYRGDRHKLKHEGNHLSC
jgi:hypothetical protein